MLDLHVNNPKMVIGFLLQFKLKKVSLKYAQSLMKILQCKLTMDLPQILNTGLSVLKV